MNDVTLNEALAPVREWKEYYISQLPEELSEKLKALSTTNIREQYHGAEWHVNIIYELGFTLGPNLTCQTRFSKEPLYIAKTQDVLRHLQDGPKEVHEATRTLSQGDDELSEYLTLIAPKVRRNST
jgi:predicted DNA-binding protein